MQLNINQTGKQNEREITTKPIGIGIEQTERKTPQEKISQQALQYDENRVQRQIKGIDYFCPLQDLHYLCHNKQQYYYEENFCISIIIIMLGCQCTD